MNERPLGFDTLAIHAGQEVDKDTRSIAPPIYQTTAYQFDSAEHARRLFALEEGGNIYTRLSNPTCDLLERRITALEGGVGAMCTASGHSAMTLALLNLAGAGDEFISASTIYGGAINLFAVSMKNLGITVHLVQPDDIANFEAKINDKTKAVFVEAMGNPSANVVDIGALSALCKKHGLPLMVDSTFTTPYLLDAKAAGADIIIHSATKYLGGHGTAMGGLVVDCGTFPWKGNPRFPQFNEPDMSYHGVVYADLGPAAYITRLRTQMLRDFGPCLSPFNAFLLLQGIETLPLRMRRHCDNAQRIAEFLEAQADVCAVHYPGLKSSKYNALAEKYLPRGASGIMTVELSGGKERGIRFIDALKLFLNVANLGDVRSLVIHPASTTHSQLSEEQLRAADLSGGLVRLSVGLEDCEDLIADLAQAIEASR